MEFRKYHSVENSYRKKMIDKIIEEGHSKKTFIVQEKIHGANFSFWLDSDQTRYAKRSGFLKKGEGFFNYEEVVKKYNDKMRQLFDLLKERGAKEVVVFGELYGGEYPHDDVPKNHQKSVQKEVYYSPEQDFMAFDLKVDGYYQSVPTMNSLFEEFGIPYVKTLYTGLLEDCLNYPKEYQTTIPRELGLPEIEGNICEGNVIRPVEPIFLWSGERLILKNKNEKFSEKSHKAKKPKKEQVELSESAKKGVDLVNEYITENRLKNVLSKMGEIKQNDFGRIMKNFTSDIMEDFTKDNEDFVNSLEKEDKKMVNKQVGQQAAELLRSNFVNILDGEF